MNTRTKFYCWLIGKLEHRKMTLQEIIDEWSEAASNLDDKELSTRTFHRYREEIASMFGIEIECDKANGYRYYIHRDRYTDTEITDWMLSALRIASLGDTLKYHSKVVLEEAPQNTEYLDDILGAIDKHYSLRFRYRNPYAEEYDMEIVPMFVRLFHQRWYVIGARVKDEAPRVLPFDRISNMEVVCKKHTLSPETRKKMSPDNFYDGCFGIIRQDNLPVLDVRIRVFFPENNYIDEVPLHESQRKICDAEDHSYTDYSLRVAATRDFEQELLWHGRKIIVLSPESLKQEMIGILKDMTESYETKRNTCEE